MATGFNLPSPSFWEIHDVKVAEKWKKLSLASDNDTLATELDKKLEKVQVATLLTIIVEEARDVFRRLQTRKMKTVRKKCPSVTKISRVLSTS